MTGSIQVGDSRRAPGALLVALAVLALLACALAPAARAETVEFGSGQLDWGVKKSFRDYIVGPLAHGVIDAFSGATRNPDGTFRFQVYAGSYDDAAGGEIRANGSVRFVGHDFGWGPTLELTVSDPVIVVDGAESVLRADVVSRPMEGIEPGDPVTYTDVELADLGPAGLTPVPVSGPDGRAFGPAPAILTAAGAPPFGQYEAGTALDPVSATAFLGDPGAEPPDEPAPPLPPSPKKETPELQPQPQPQPEPQPTDAATTPAPTPQTQSQRPAHKPKPKRCKKGFRKAKVKGKPGKKRCVKRKKSQSKKSKRQAAKRKAAAKRRAAKRS